MNQYEYTHPWPKNNEDIAVPCTTHFKDIQTRFDVNHAEISSANRSQPAPNLPEQLRPRVDLS